MIDQWPCSLCLPLCSYGRVYATADPYHHTIGPAATYSVGTMVSLWERRPVSVCTPCETSQHDNATHTHDSHTLQKIKTRGCSSRWFLFMCLFINWFSFLSCYLAHPAGAEQHCKEKKKTRHVESGSDNLTWRHASSPHATLIWHEFPPEMRMSDYCSVFEKLLHLYITNVHSPVHPTSLDSLQSELAHHLYFFFFFFLPIQPNQTWWRDEVELLMSVFS